MAVDGPALIRTLTLRPVILFGLAYLAPMIVLGTFGVLAETTSGSTPAAYLLALVALLFTALSYGKMSALYPVAGSAYSYTRRAIDGRLGFLVGWAVLLDYFFLPMVIWLIGAAFLSAKFPHVPTWVWIVSFIIVTSILNVLGVRAVANANLLLMMFQILILVIFVALSLAPSSPALGPAPWSAALRSTTAPRRCRGCPPGRRWPRTPSSVSMRSPRSPRRR